MKNFFGRELQLGNWLQVKIPERNDVRFILLPMFALYVTYGILNPSFNRNFSQYLIAILVGTLTDILFQLIIYKKISVFPFSSFLACHGIFLIVHSPHLWTYAIVAFLSIMLKFFVRWNDKHIFNPNNLGIVICLFFFGKQDMVINPGVWQGNNIIMLTILVLGSYIAVKVDRHRIVLAFLATFLLFSTLFTIFLNDMKTWYFFFPLSGPAFLLYVFYHITDPPTTPKGHQRQIVTGITLGIIDAFFRYHEQKYSYFYAALLNASLHFSYDFLSDFLQKKRAVLSPIS